MFMGIKQTLILIFMCVASLGVLSAQEQVPADQMWNALADITYKKKFDEFLGFEIKTPVFSKSILQREGNKIKIKGYIIPVEGYKSHKSFILSAFPYNMCYFCGGAGPETIMEVECVEGVKFTTDPIELEGILHVNQEDINELMYKLTEAKWIQS